MSERYQNARANLARRGLLGVADRIARVRRISLEAMLTGDRLRGPSAGRRELWTIMRDTLDLSHAEIGEFTGHDPSTVSSGIELHRTSLERHYGPYVGAVQS